MLVVLFLDANALVHYQHFRDLDWFSFCRPEDSASAIQLRLAASVVDELDRLKYSHPVKKLRHRINELLKAIDQAVDGQSGFINEKTSLHLESVDAALTIYQQYSLSKESCDDRLIASVLEYSSRQPESQVFLITNDIGLKQKAQLRNLEVVRMPDSLRLQDEPDARDREIHELKLLLERQALKSPDLKLAFPGSQSWATVNLLKRELTSCQIDQQLEAIKKAFPKQDESRLPEALGKYAHLAENPDHEEWKKLNFGGMLSVLASVFYKNGLSISNVKLDAFYIDYEAYLAADASYLEEISRTLQLPLMLENTGTCPGEDIDIQIKFPPGMRVVSKELLPGRPAPPSAPNQPSAIQPVKTIAAAQITSGIKLSFKRLQDGTLVEANIGRIKHLTTEALPRIYVIFDAESSIRSFQIDYSLHASNVPHKIPGHLDLKVTRSTPPTRSRRYRRRRRLTKTTE